MAHKRSHTARCVREQRNCIEAYARIKPDRPHVIFPPAQPHLQLIRRQQKGVVRYFDLKAGFSAVKEQTALARLDGVP